MGAREASRRANRQAIVEAGMARVLSDPVSMLRAVLNASLLSADTGASKDTTYRLFKAAGRSPSDAIIEEVAAAAARPEWSGFADSAEQIAKAFQECVEQEQPFDEAIIAAMAANADNQFRSLGCPVGWIFHAVAMTASPVWEGSAGLSEEDRALAETLLDIRARFYDQMTDDLLQIMIASISLINRRPRRGMDPRQLLAILHSMIDGAVLRRYIQPDVFDSRMIGEAVYALALAFSEDGTLGDPRRPATDEGSVLFDAMLERAAASWPSPTARTVDSTAAEAAISAETAHLLFPSTADLADALVWSSVLGGGSLVDQDHADGSGPRTELPLILGLLRRLREVADILPGAIAVVCRQEPTIGTGVRTELEREIAEIVRRHCPGVDPSVTAHELIGAALLGTPGWSTVLSLVRVLSPSLSGGSSAGSQSVADGPPR